MEYILEDIKKSFCSKGYEVKIFESKEAAASYIESLFDGVMKKIGKTVFCTSEITA